MNFTLEICVDSVESAVIVQEAGADRIELCCSMQTGGLTPGYGLIRSVMSNVDIPVHVLIRPRGNDFLYSSSEFEIMRKDVEFCGESGVSGVVFGILNADGSVDTGRCSLLAGFARPMSITFHRAFDVCADPFKSLEDIISTGADRILTSGRQTSALEGSELIKMLVEKASGRISLMPGGGINENNIEAIALTTGAAEFHMSAGIMEESMMVYRNEKIFRSITGENYFRKTASREMISAVIRKLKNI